MTDNINEKIAKRGEALAHQNKARGGPSFMVVGLASVIALAGAAGGIAYFLNGDETARFATSDAEEYQRDGGRADLQFERFAEPEPELTLQLPTTETVNPDPATVDTGAHQAEIDLLREDINVLLKTIEDGQAGNKGWESLRDRMESEIASLRKQLEEKNRESEAARNEWETRIAGLETLLETEKSRREALQTQIVNNQYLADEEKRAEAQRLAAQELHNRQIRSSSLVYAPGQAASAEQTSANEDPASSSRSLSDNEQFIREAPPLIVQEAQQMTDPHRTLAQGSVIQASLQVAINSDLPGNVVAVVSEPVPSFTGDSILVPRGSRLFGSYSAGVQAGQKRILVAWNRILTPDGTSMNISSVGGDSLGRSGLTGHIDKKFWERFGGAALISIIGAAPSIAARRVDDEVGRDTLEAVGEDLTQATDTVIADQLSRSPTIYIDQGASVTVLVDRDVVVF